MNGSDTLIARKKDSEKQFIAAAFINPEVAVKEFSYILPVNFVDITLGKFWGALLAGGDPYRAASEAGILTDITQMVAETPTTCRLDIYAEKLQRDGHNLVILEQSQKLAALCLDNNLEGALEQVGAMEMAKTLLDAETTSQDAQDVARDFEESLNEGWDAIPTGLPKLDLALGKLQRGQVSIWASRTGNGKTALMWQIADFNAYNKIKRRKTIYVSTELSARFLWVRASSGRARVDWRNIVGVDDPDQALIARIKIESDRLAKRLHGQLFIDDKARTLGDIHKTIAVNRPDLMIIDHLGELTPDRISSGNDNLVYWLGEAVSYLRSLAQKYNCHIIIVHQLSRGLESRADHRPVLADLRDSGKIEEKADVVAMLHREDAYDPNKLVRINGMPVTPMEVYIRKNRIGARDDAVVLSYNLLEQHFQDTVKAS